MAFMIRRKKYEFLNRHLYRNLQAIKILRQMHFNLINGFCPEKNASIESENLKTLEITNKIN